MSTHHRNSEVEIAVEAAAVLLRKESKRSMSRLRLLKLLYIASRRAIKETGRPILASGLAALPHGPIHSEVYNLICESHPNTDRWAKFVANEGPRDLRLIGQPHFQKLSKHQVELLQKVSDELALMNDWEIAHITETFPEWTKNYPVGMGDTSRPIPIEDLVESVAPDESEEILRGWNERAEFDRLFSG